MREDVIKFDLPVDYIITDEHIESSLNDYMESLCRVMSGLFVLCTKGEVHISINVSEYVIKENNFITLLPNYLIQVHEISPDVHLYVAGFSSKMMASANLISSTRGLLPMIIENPITSLSPTKVCDLEALYRVFIKSYANPDVCENKEVVKAILALFMQGVYELYKRRNKYVIPSQTRKNEVYREFMLMVMKYYKLQHGVAFYAERLGLSLPHFCNSIKKASGYTPLEVIAAALIMDAKAQLKSTTLPIKEIGLSLGFTNLSFFNQFFKKHTGVTPQSFREE